LSVKETLEYYKLLLTIFCVTYLLSSATVFEATLGKISVYDKIVIENLKGGKLEIKKKFGRSGFHSLLRRNDARVSER